MFNDIMRALDREYDRLREQSAERLRRRRAHLIESCPQYRALDEEVCRVNTEWAKKAIADPGAAQSCADEVAACAKAFEAQERKILAEHGYPPDYLVPETRCSLCADTGYVGDSLLRRCTCLTQRLLERAYRSSGLNPDDGQDFEHFDEEAFPQDVLRSDGLSQREAMRRIRDRCLEFAERFPDNEKPHLLFVGETGLGKTFLLDSITKRVLARGHSAVKLTAYRLGETLMDAYRGREGAKERLHLLEQAELVAIDDLGVEPLYNNVTLESLFALVNERMSLGRAMILSTNLMPAQIMERYSERLSSRLLDSARLQMLRFEGRDLRIRAKR